MRWYQSPIRIVEPADKEGLAQCQDCGEWKSDPDDFYDGLRCTECCEEPDVAPCVSGGVAMTFEEAKRIHKRMVRKIGQGKFDRSRDGDLWDRAQAVLHKHDAWGKGSR